tara:strand:+ start:1061 stop:1324 length:264 start_codon:yes stop_codon:yes gene_type:complete
LILNDKEGTDDWKMTPRELIQDREVETDHYKRVLQSNLEYPIHVYFFKGSWKILDGVHRFTRAFVEKKDTVFVYKAKESDLQKINRC